MSLLLLRTVSALFCRRRQRGQVRFVFAALPVAPNCTEAKLTRSPCRECTASPGDTNCRDHTGFWFYSWKSAQMLLFPRFLAPGRELAAAHLILACTSPGPPAIHVYCSYTVFLHGSVLGWLVFAATAGCSWL